MTTKMKMKSMTGLNSKYLMLTGIAIVAAIALSSSAHAFTYCVNSSWLGENLTRTIDGSIRTFYSVDKCNFGCDSKLLQCNPSQWEFYTGPLGNLGLIGMVLAIMIIIVGLVKWSGK
jgi:hypothetical protein